MIYKVNSSNFVHSNECAFENCYKCIWRYAFYHRGGLKIDAGPPGGVWMKWAYQNMVSFYRTWHLRSDHQRKWILLFYISYLRRHECNYHYMTLYHLWPLLLHLQILLHTLKYHWEQCLCWVLIIHTIHLSIWSTKIRNM